MVLLVHKINKLARYAVNTLFHTHTNTHRVCMRESSAMYTYYGAKVMSRVAIKARLLPLLIDYMQRYKQ